ncbi:MAG TPA: hypothetical protein VIA63_08160 [Candidatus Limnocylindria bacterium]|jgi:hypothetical protein
MPQQQGLSADEVERETAVPLPERDAMSVVAGAKLVPISPLVIPPAQQPPTPLGDAAQSIDEGAPE